MQAKHILERTKDPTVQMSCIGCLHVSLRTVCTTTITEITSASDAVVSGMLADVILLTWPKCTLSSSLSKEIDLPSPNKRDSTSQ